MDMVVMGEIDYSDKAYSNWIPGDFKYLPDFLINEDIQEGYPNNKLSDFTFTDNDNSLSQSRVLLSQAFRHLYL